MRRSSRLRLLTKRLCLSAAVKKTFVTLVSTRTTSSEFSVTSSSFFGGVGVACAAPSLRRGRLEFCDCDWLCASDAQVNAAAIVTAITSAHNVLDLLSDKTFTRSEEHTSELQSHSDLVCRLLLEKKK